MESQNGAAPDGAGAFGGMAFYNDAAPLALGMGAFRSSLPSFASVKSSQSGPRQEFEQKETKETKGRHEEKENTPLPSFASLSSVKNHCNELCAVKF
jgi:hypothetical protein